MINTKLCKICSFLSIVYWNVHVSSSAKSSFWACWFFQPSSLPDFLEKPISLALHPQHTALSTLQSGFQSPAVQWFAVDSSYWIEWFFFFCSLHSSPSLPLQHFYHGATSPTVFPPLTMLSSVVTQSGHITVT